MTGSLLSSRVLKSVEICPYNLDIELEDALCDVEALRLRCPQHRVNLESLPRKHTVVPRKFNKKKGGKKKYYDVSSESISVQPEDDIVVAPKFSSLTSLMLSSDLLTAVRFMAHYAISDLKRLHIVSPIIELTNFNVLLDALRESCPQI